MFSDAFRALRSRNFRLFFFGQGVSMIGTWMQQVAMGWLVYRLTHSMMTLGVVGFVTRCPSFFVTPFTGVLVDRVDRYRALLITQVLSLVQASILAGLVLSGHAQIWHLMVLGFGLGLINAFDVPIRQTFVIEMIDRREDLSNAIALNSTLNTAARLVGPVVAGGVIYALGEGWCFSLNAISFIAVLASLLMMRLPQTRRVSAHSKGRKGFKEGLKASFGSLPIRSLLLLLALSSLAGMPYQTLMPVFASDLLHGGPHTLGFLGGAVGLGSLCAALYLASRRTVLGLAWRVGAASVLFGAALAGFAVSRSLWFSLPLLTVAGFGMMIQLTGCNTLVQTLVDDEHRGRVMSFHTMAFLGTVPFGNLLGGWLADRLGPQNAVLLGGAVCCLSGIYFLLRLNVFRHHVRPIYQAKGILPAAEASGA